MRTIRHTTASAGTGITAILRILGAVVLTALLLAACGGDSGAQVENETGAASDAGSGDTAADAAKIPDACTFIDREEISAAIGRELEEGEPRSTASGASECEFETALGMDASTSYPDPVVPETTLASVLVSTHQSSPEEFDAFRDTIGDEAEIVTDVGDAAYFWGPDVIYVRVADRGFSIRITADGAEQEALREALLTLAQAGVSSYQQP